MVPVSPESGVVGCACSSWPSAGWITTSSPLTVPSSASVTETSQDRSSPKSKKEPFGGSPKSSSGRVLPTVIGTVVVPSLPAGSVTVSRALNTPVVA